MTIKEKVLRFSWRFSENSIIKEIHETRTTAYQDKRTLYTHIPCFSLYVNLENSAAKRQRRMTRTCAGELV